MAESILITGLVPGYPNQNLSLKIAQTLIKAGADILELSASFSEPIADGPTLQLAHKRVLDSSFNKHQSFNLYRKIAKLTDKPLFLIEYGNIIYQWGFDRYYHAAAMAGIKYLAVPDVPLEESAPFVEAAKKYNIAQIFLIAPTTPNERVLDIARKAQKTVTWSENLTRSQLPSSFLYLVSVTGVTGSRKTVSAETINFIKRVRSLTNLPLIVGFGISKSAHIKAVIAAGADGIVTCSPIVDIIHKKQKIPARMLKAISDYVKSLTCC
jgi:tryptophan synthase alpha chain